MPGLIEQRSGKVLGGFKTLIELFGRDDLLKKSLRKGLPGLVVFGVILQHFRPGRPHLIDLGRVLDKIARHARPAEAWIFYARKHSMQRVAEFMKNRAYFIMSQQGWLTRRRLGDIQMICD